MMSREQRWTTQDVASWRKRSVRTIYRLVAKGLIPAKKDGRQLSFDPMEVEKAWAALPPAGRARVAAMPPSATRRPIDLAAALRYKVQHWCDPPPDELAARRKQKGTVI